MSNKENKCTCAKCAGVTDVEIALERAKGIMKYGYTIQAVFSDKHTWCYTIGNTKRDLPELLIIGCPNEIVTNVFKLVHEKALVDGEFKLGEHVLLYNDDGKPEFKVILREVHENEEDFSLAQARYHAEVDQVRVVQVIWIDAHGRSPLDQQCLDFGGLQPVLKEVNNTLH